MMPISASGSSAGSADDDWDMAGTLAARDHRRAVRRGRCGRQGAAAVDVDDDPDPFEEPDELDEEPDDEDPEDDDPDDEEPDPDEPLELPEPPSDDPFEPEPASALAPDSDLAAPARLSVR